MKTWCLTVALLVLLSGLALSQTEGDVTTTIAPEVTTEVPTEITTEPAGTTSPDFTTVCEAVNYVTSAVTAANTCNATAACNGLNCNLAVLQSEENDHSVSIAFLPCLTPPSFKVTIRSFLGEIFNAFVSETQTILQEELFGQELVLEVDQQGDRVGFQIRTVMEDFDTGDPMDVVLVPNVYYPVDGQVCSEQTLCSVITKLASGQNSQGSCTVTPRCDGILCSLSPTNEPVLTVDLTAKIVQCNEPTAVQLIITDPADGRDLANEVLTNSSSVVNVLGNRILVALDQFSTESAVGVQVQVEVLGEFESTVMPVLDYTYLPVTREGQMCDVYSPTCLAFQGVVDKASRSNVTCLTTDRCDGVKCFMDLLDNGALFESTSTLSCFNSEPSLDLILREPIIEGQQGDILLNRTVFEETTNINILGFDIVINLERLTGQSAIGFEVMLLSTDEGEETPVIQYSEIPFDANICSGCAFVTTSLLVMLMSTLLGVLGSR